MPKHAMRVPLTPMQLDNPDSRSPAAAILTPGKEAWRVHYGDVQVGTITKRTGTLAMHLRLLSW